MDKPVREGEILEYPDFRSRHHRRFPRHTGRGEFRLIRAVEALFLLFRSKAEDRKTETFTG
jgi:hypothetical protein